MNHNVVELPSTKAKLLVDEARAAYMKNDRNTARTKLDGAFALKAEVERYTGLVWDYVHDAFTEVMLDMAELWFKLDDCEQGRKLARHAQAWADDPCCGGNQRHFKRSFKLRKQEKKLQWHGRLRWLRTFILR